MGCVSVCTRQATPLPARNRTLKGPSSNSQVLIGREPIRALINTPAPSGRQGLMSGGILELKIRPSARKQQHFDLGSCFCSCFFPATQTETESCTHTHTHTHTPEGRSHQGCICLALHVSVTATTARSSPVAAFVCELFLIKSAG